MQPRQLCIAVSQTGRATGQVVLQATQVLSTQNGVVPEQSSSRAQLVVLPPSSPGGSTSAGLGKPQLATSASNSEIPMRFETGWPLREDVHGANRTDRHLFIN